MRRPDNYFVLNKYEDYIQGFGENVRYLSPGITVLDAGKKEGWYITKVFDSREKQMVWQQLLVKGETISEACVSCNLYASDEQEIVFRGKRHLLHELLRDPKVSIKDKLACCAPYLQFEIVDPKDVLLHTVCGRYVWMMFQLKVQGEKNPRITDMKLLFPKRSWLPFLPDVYQEYKDSAYFLERYLEIFETLHFDVNERIRTIAGCLDPDAVTKPFLEWLSEWIGLEDANLWNETQLRYLMKHMTQLYQIRGTRQYLQELIKLYIGSEPYIVEYHQVEPYMTDAAALERLVGLYGDSEFLFTVIVNAGRHVSNREYRMLSRIVSNAKPADMSCRLIVLESYIYLDQYSYLGVNSVLGDYAVPVMDGATSMTYMKLE